VQNPAGSSFVLVAEEDSKLVGLRIFMLWDIQIGGTTYKALRPVDTAVHKDYQGKGLFKKLTLQGLEMFRSHIQYTK
jgi:predicted N-acetyltransferase YhbS